ncbi:MAG: hypothetical protein NDF54_07670 [archaeon GB-1867-035]|nr:hypothetical protein [Candidatus Culexmicrobium profundum]
MKRVYCVWLIATDHHSINDYVVLFKELKIRRFNVINSKDEHYLIFIFEGDEEIFEKVKEWALLKVGLGVYFSTAFEIDPVHRYQHSGLGEPLYKLPRELRQ